MSNAQKNYLKKWALVLGVISGVVLMITFIALGEPWHWITFGVVVLALVAFLAGLVATVIASLVWHWRLMGVCENQWEEAMLAYWWRYMNYWGGCWEDLIPRIIEEDTDEELGIERKQQMELFERFKAVKAPRVLQW